eukprot:2882494-Karenia_brevis.AAC.1
MEEPRTVKIDGIMPEIDLHRVTLLVTALRDPEIDLAVLTVPEAWIPSHEFRRSQFYEGWIRNGSLAQANQFAYWQPTPGVPAFDKETAAGKPGIWNFAQPTAMKRKQGQTFTLRVTEGLPDIQKVVEFLRMRTDQHDRPLTDGLGVPQSRGNGWWELRNFALDESALPTKTLG